jgi:hypothetical protein
MNTKATTKKHVKEPLQGAPTARELEDYCKQRETYRAKRAELTEWAEQLPRDNIDFLCNSGLYNFAIRGYLITAAECAGFTKEQTEQLLRGLKQAFTLKDKRQAEETYYNY